MLKSDTSDTQHSLPSKVWLDNRGSAFGKLSSWKFDLSSTIEGSTFSTMCWNRELTEVKVTIHHTITIRIGGIELYWLKQMTIAYTMDKRF